MKKKKKKKHPTFCHIKMYNYISNIKIYSYNKYKLYGAVFFFI